MLGVLRPSLSPFGKKLLLSLAKELRVWVIGIEWVELLVARESVPDVKLRKKNLVAR